MQNTEKDDPQTKHEGEEILAKARKLKERSQEPEGSRKTQAQPVLANPSLSAGDQNPGSRLKGVLPNWTLRREALIDFSLEAELASPRSRFQKVPSAEGAT